ncbi:unnamed protein product [Polarella glacialis]|uniref:Uncharacterized protein n=1 Tax=Polarella glacialis TaxID=89957 RepID=A0A813DXW3_POLGL|nr:unnamed protein product [Polarella glacialis]
MLRKILELSEREEKERTRRQELEEEEAFLAALAASQQQVCTGEDESLQKALEISQKLQEERARQDEREEADLQRVSAESLRFYELFHASVDDEALAYPVHVHDDAGPADGSVAGFAEEDEGLQAAIQLAYNEESPYGDADEEEEEEEVFFQPHLKQTVEEEEEEEEFLEVIPEWKECDETVATDMMPQATTEAQPHFEFDAPPRASAGAPFLSSSSSSAAAAASSSAAAASSSAAAAASSSPSEGASASASTNDASSSSKPAPPSSKEEGVEGGDSPFDYGEGFSIRQWFLQRSAEIGIEDFDPEVLWSALSEVEEAQLGDDEVIKMWLGFPPEDKLPDKILRLVAEFRQARCLLRFSSG